MFSAFRDWCERWLRIPADPEPPPGDEARTQRFRAAPNFYKYLLFIWGLKSIGLIAVLLPSTVLPLVALLLSTHAHQVIFTESKEDRIVFDLVSYGTLRHIIDLWK